MKSRKLPTTRAGRAKAIALRALAKRRWEACTKPLTACERCPLLPNCRPFVSGDREA